MSGFALRGEKGVWINNGPPSFDAVALGEFDNSSKLGCRASAFSADGALFAFADGRTVTVVDSASFDLVAEIEIPFACGLCFSQTGHVLAVLEPHASGKPNLHIFDVTSANLGSDVKRIRSFVQKRQHGWSMVWSKDDKVAVVNITNELLFFENGSYEHDRRFGILKVSEFALAVSAPLPIPVGIYVAGSRGQSAHVKIFAYPNFAQMLASWKCDRSDHAVLSWNKSGTKLLILLASGKDSYSPNYTIQLMGVDGSCVPVSHPTEGPVYSVQWNPNGEQFCAVYGYEPASATLYSTLGEPIFDFGTGPRNNLFFSEPHGSLLCFAGFKNLHGKFEVWDVRSRLVVGRFDSSDATHMQWMADGLHIVTSTVAPNLRYNNGFKVWHYSGTLLQEFTSKDVLWDVTCRPAIEGTYPDLPVLLSQPDSTHEAKPEQQHNAVASGDSLQMSKQLKNLQKKLQQIEKLKQQRDAGKKLELNQLEKLSGEQALLKEIASLRLH